FHFCGDLLRHSSGSRTFLPRISENAKPFEPGAFDEIEQRLELGVSFARKTDNKGRAQRNSGNSGTQFCNQFFYVGSSRLAPHSSKHRFIDVLQRDVDIAGDMFAFADRRNELITPMGWLGIEK